MKKLILFVLIGIFPFLACAAPTVTEYAKCNGILILAAAMTKENDPEKFRIYMENAKALESKASKLKGYDKGVFREMSFDSSGNYMDMLKGGAASKQDFWADAGYCRGLAQ